MNQPHMLTGNVSDAFVALGVMVGLVLIMVMPGLVMRLIEMRKERSQ